MVTFIKKDLLVFWRDRKEVLISLLAPILLIVVLNFIFSGITFDDAGDMELHVGWVQDDVEAAGLERFEQMLRETGLAEWERAAMLEQAASLRPISLIEDLFRNPEINSWIHTYELSEAAAIEQVENGELDAIVKIPEGFTLDVLRQVMLNVTGDASLILQIEEHSIETDILTDIIDQYMETVNFQIALGTVVEGEMGEVALPQGGREVINENAVEIDLAQYFTVAMSTLFSLFIAATVAAKTETEKRERVFHRILLTNSRPLSYLMGKVMSTFVLTWIQLILVFLISHLLLGVFPEKSTSFWLHIVLMITIFSFVIGGLSAIFTSVTLRMNNSNAAQGLFTVLIMGMAALGGNFFPMEQLPAWMQALSKWTPTGVTVSVFTDMLQNGDGVSLVMPLLKQSGFFIVFLLIGILLFPGRGKA